MKKKVLAWMLSVFMVVTMMPLPAFANTTETQPDTQPAVEETVEDEVVPNATAEGEGTEESEVKGEDFEGSGTVEDPYKISKVEDWKLFAEKSQGGESFSGKVLKLTADIDFNGANFLEIAEDGTVATDYRIPKFSGTFDGGGHTVKNFNFVVKNTGSNSIMIFSQDNMWAYIKNLNIENVNVKVADISGETRITALANRVNAGGMTDAAIKNVHIKNFKVESNNTTSNDLRIGGLAYFVQGSQLIAEDCSIEGFEVDVNSANIVGGAVGIVKSKCDFENVDVNAVFKVDNVNSIIGGFAGQTQDKGTGTTFTDCDVNVQMTIGNSVSDVGGFIAQIGSVSQFYNCTTTGSINVTSDNSDLSVGGFVGNLGWNGMYEPDVQHEFNNCIADVDITAVNATVGGFIGDSTVSGYPKRYMPTYFNNCEAKGDVETVNGAAGGFVGRGDRGIFNDCSASGNVEGEIAGGFWGEIYPKAEAESTGGWSYQDKVVTHTDADSKKIKLEGNTATGTVTGTEYEAGLIGYMKDVHVNADSELGYATPIVLKDNNTSDYNRYEYPEGTEEPEVSVSVAKIGDEKYMTLAAAIAEATAGDTITLLTDITEDVTVDKKLTIDGANKTYTGKITAKADLTIKNVNFDGKGYNGYAIETRGASYLTVEDCTAKNYGYGFIQLASGTALTTVKHVTISDMNYGVKIDYSNEVILDNVNIDVAVAGVLNSNYGEKTITIKDSAINIYGTWTRNNTTKSNIVFEGENTVDEFKHDANIDTFKLAVGATLEAPEGMEFITDPDYDFKYENGKYTVVDYVSGTWGGIDWTLTKDGTLTIAPTKGTPVADKNSGKTYEVGEWREAVRYDSKGEGKAIEGWPYDRTKVKTLVIEEGVTSIGSFTAQSFTNLTGEVVIPSTVTYIGQEAFQKSTFTKLTFAEVPEGEEGKELCIAQGAFKNLIIEEVSLPADRPVHLHAWVFNNCHNLKSATLPATLVSVHGTNHIDYFKDFNAHSNPTWTKSSEIFAYNENMETITFGSEEVREMFYANNNGTSKDYTVANVGLTTYCDLQAAVDAAQNGETVKLIKNVTLTDTLTVPADKKITLDLNGKTIEQEKACTESYEMISNKGNLTITGNGKISFTDTGAGDPNAGWGSYTLRNEGTLVVENGTIENLSAQNQAGQPFAHTSLAIFQYSGSTTINDGTISTPNYRPVRLWKGEMTINGGTFDGQVWIHCVDDSAKMTINGGNFSPNWNDGSSVFVNNSGYDAEFSVTGGTFETKIGANDVEALAGAITGGAFTEAAKNETNAVLLAEGYVFEENADGTYGVVCGLEGKGTEAEPFLIYDVEDLIFFRDSVNAGETVFNAEGVHVALADNIDMEDVDWSVNIGDDCNYTFDGIFDGNNKTIKNLTIKETAQKSDGYICTGLFGAIGGNAVIKNLTIKNVEIDTGDFTGNNVAAVVGFAYKATGSVEDVTVKGDIIINAAVNDGVGTIVGYAYGGELTIINCTVEGNSDSIVDGRAYVGGIIGYAGGKTTIEGCTVEDLTVNANSCCAAGIAGILLNGGVATGNTVEEATMTAAHENWQNSAAIVAGAITTGSVTVAGTTYDDVNTELLVGCVHENKPTTPVKKVAACVNDVYYTDFAPAYAAANDGDTITLFRAVEVAAGETLTLDKAVTIEYTSNVPGEDMFTNHGTMVVDGATLVYVNTDTTANNVTVSTISSEPGSVLEVKSGVVKNDSANNAAKGIYAYAIDILTNGNLGDVTATISGGEVISTNYMAIRQFNNGTACKNTLTVTAGYIYGAKRAIQVHLMNDAAYTTISGGKIEAGREGYALCLYPTDSTNISVAGGEFIGIVYSGTNGIISGGTFDQELYEGYIADGYKLEENSNGTYGVVEDYVYGKVAQIGTEYFSTLAEAIAAANTGDEITLLANITENVTVNKNITIDGAEHQYTGTITVSNGKTVTVENVNFVKGCIDKAKGTSGTLTVKNCDFDGVDDSINYAITMRGGNTITVEGATVKNYGYGFIYVPSATSNVNVTGTTVENVNYGVHVAYGSKINLENVTMTNVAYGIMTQNYGAKTVTVKNCQLTGTNPIYVWERNTTTVDTFNFEGENTVSALPASAQAKLVLTAGAELTAPEGANVTTNVADHKAVYKDGKYTVVAKNYIAQNGETKYESLQEAIDAAEEGDTVKVITDITLAKGVTVSADKKITLDLNGKTISGTHGTDYSMIHVLNGAELTVDDTSTEQNGKITCAAGGNNTGANVWVEGKLTLESGTIEVTGTWNLGFAVDLRPNAWGTAHTVGASFIMNGGTVKSTDTAVRIASNSSDTYEELGVTFTMNDGTIESAWDAIFVQHLYNGDLDINVQNGSVSGENSVLRIYGNEGSDIDMNVKNGNFNGEIKVADAYAGTDAIEISGGIFDRPVKEDYCAEGYIPCENADGTYGVVQGEYIAAVGDEKYETLQDALYAAEAGTVKTVTLLVDHEEGSIIVPAGVTLDLAGKKLEAKYFVSFGQTADNSEDNTGVLVSSNIMLQQNNKQLPIKNAELGGYQFFEVKGFNSDIYNGAYVFQPVFEVAAHELLLKGSEASEVSTGVEVKWSNDDGKSFEQTFIYPDEEIKTVVGSYNAATGKYGQMYTLKISNAENYPTLAYNVVLKTELGVIKVSASTNHNN